MGTMRLCPQPHLCGVRKHHKGTLCKKQSNPHFKVPKKNLPTQPKKQNLLGDSSKNFERFLQPDFLHESKTAALIQLVEDSNFELPTLPAGFFPYLGNDYKEKAGVFFTTTGLTVLNERAGHTILVRTPEGDWDSSSSEGAFGQQKLPKVIFSAPRTTQEGQTVTGIAYLNEEGYLHQETSFAYIEQTQFEGMLGTFFLWNYAVSLTGTKMGKGNPT